MTAESEFDSRQGKSFSLLHNVETRRGTNPVFNPLGNEGLFPAVKPLELADDHSRSSNCDYKLIGSHVFISPHAYMA
jgi:hypothetical protein